MKENLALKSILSLLLSCLSAYSLAQTYATPVTESRWQLQSTPFSCRLTHKVEGFGEWYVERKTREQEQNRLVMDPALQRRNKVQLPKGSYQLMTAPPAWRQELVAESMGEIIQLQQDAPLTIPPDLLPVIFALFEQTMPVMFSYQGQPLRIELEPYQFKDSYKGYKACVTDLIPYSFEQILRTTLHYQIEDAELSTLNRQALDKIIRYAKADPNRIVSVLIDAHSDSYEEEGKADTIANTQAQLIASYLKDKGIAEDKLVVRSHADKYPIANNQIPKERAKNRRVTVRLEDEALHQKALDKIAERKKQEEAKASEAAASSAAAVERAANSSAPDFGDKLPIELELERMIEGQDLEKPSPSEMPSP